MKDIKDELELVKFFINVDFKIAIDAFHKLATDDNNKAGCYSLLRIIFPLIDYMAQLVSGKVGNTSTALKKYIHDDMGKLNFRYQQCAGLLVYMYRHGLMHQLHPNRIKYKGAIVEWNLYYREAYKKHLVCEKEGQQKKRLYFDIEQFAKDFLGSVENYENALKVDDRLRKNFSSASKIIADPLDPDATTKKWLDKLDFSILNC